MRPPSGTMNKHVVDLTEGECYYCGRGQKDLDKMQKKINKILGNSDSLSSNSISQLEENHRSKISEALKILKGINSKMKLSTIRTDLDAFVGEEVPYEGSTYSTAPVINIVRSMLLAGIPIGQSWGNSLSYVTSIRSYVLNDVDNENEDGDYIFTKKEREQIYDLYDKWIKLTNAENFGYSGHEVKEIDIPFKKLLPIYLEWIPLMFKYDFSYCEDYTIACEELTEKKIDHGKITKLSLIELELHSGSSEDVKVMITRCTICADQMNLIFSELSRKENATNYN